VLHASHSREPKMNPVTRAALIMLAALVVIGLMVSFIPNAQKVPLGQVQLDGVNLELYPAADPDAKWVFNASTVTVDPETRESIATLNGDGIRYIKGKPDLYLRATTVTIDGNDNLRTQEAKIYIPKGCYILKLGQPGAAFVTIDQNTGYSAPYADMQSETFNSIGTDFTSNFEIDNFKMTQIDTNVLDGNKKLTCAKVRKNLGFLN
jgi:hypothetical protein